MQVRGTNQGVSAPAQKVQRPRGLEDNVLTAQSPHFGFQLQYVTNGCHVESSFHPSPFGEISDVNCIWLISCSVMSVL